MRYLFLFVISFMFFGSLPAGETLTGRIVGVTDGDTVKVLTTDKKEVKIRLYGVDAPEKAQPFGQKAKQFASDLVFGKDVRVEVIDTDRYGRSVAFVRTGPPPSELGRTGEGITLNERLVESGFAWHYPQYCKRQPLCGQLAALEKEARTKKLGLWADPDPTPPWQWRKDKKAHKSKAEVGDPPSQKLQRTEGGQPSQKLRTGEGEGEDTEPDLYQEMIKKKDEAVDKVNRDHEQEQKAKKQEGMWI